MAKFPWRSLCTAGVITTRKEKKIVNIVMNFTSDDTANSIKTYFLRAHFAQSL